MARIPDIDVETLDEEGRRVYDAIASGPRGRVEGPLRVWLASPKLADRAQALGAFCRYGTSLPPRLSELAILVVGAHWRAPFEWHVHAPIAAAAGLEADVIEAVRIGARPVFPDPEARTVHDFARELVERRRLSDATYAAFVERFGTRCAVELVGILGYYSLISMTIVAFEVDLPEGAACPFGDGSD